MSESMTLELPAEVARRARVVAAATNRRVEDVVVEWIERIAAESPMEDLPDSDVLELSRSQMSEDNQTALSDLLSRQPRLTEVERNRLEELLAGYRRGLVLKARATKEAVSRGLTPRLNGDGT
jgi:hypothetical protein